MRAMVGSAFSKDAGRLREGWPALVTALLFEAARQSDLRRSDSRPRGTSGAVMGKIDVDILGGRHLVIAQRPESYSVVLGIGAGGVEASLAVAADLQTERASLERRWRQRLESVQYEVDQERVAVTPVPSRRTGWWHGPRSGSRSRWQDLSSN
jgi:hypothetical protein